MADGRTWIRGHQRVTCTPGSALEEGGDPTWKIVGWHSKGLETMSVDRPLFSEVADQVMTADALIRARRSIHEKHVLEFLLNPVGFKRPHPLFSVMRAIVIPESR